MDEPKTMTVENGGFVCCNREGTTGTHRRSRSPRVILTADEAVALGHQLLRLSGGPEPFG